MKKRIIITSLLALFLTLPALALRFESGENIRISQAVYEDIYVFSGTIYIDAPVYGDIWCAGGTVTVSDTVTGDIVLAGGNIYLRGTVLDDVRAAVGTLIVSGHIGGDLLVTGGTISVEPTAVIDGTVALSGGTVVFSGIAQGVFKFVAGKLEMNGTVGKDFEFNGSELALNGTIGGASKLVAQNITIGENAALRGPVRYWAQAGEVAFGNALQSGATATFDRSLQKHFDQPDAKFLGFASFLAVVWYLLAGFTLLWLGQWLFGQTFKAAATTASAEPVRSLGYGFLYFVVVPVAIVLLFITVIGIPVGLIALLFYGLFFALASIITALVGANWINQRKAYNWRLLQIVFVALGLLVVLKMLTFIPFLGWIVKIAAILIAFGAILDNSRIFRRDRASA